jgi:hypothetical protein
MACYIADYSCKVLAVELVEGGMVALCDFQHKPNIFMVIYSAVATVV